MQPEPNDTFIKDSLNSSTQYTQQSSEHGLPHLARQPSYQLLAGERRHQSRPTTTHRAPSDISSEASGGSGGASEESLRRLKPSRSQAGSPVDRISEHEKALTRLSKKKRGGPVFTVIQKSKKHGGSEIGIADFPNGKGPTSRR